jgi:hypothetical protein
MESLVTRSSGFYDVGAIRKVAINLFYGWGYNFYRLENQQRSTDLLVRAKAGEFLNQAVSDMTAAETAYRRLNIPEPSRANPFPPADVVNKAIEINQFSKEIQALEGNIRAAPTPENDRMWQMHRGEAKTLQSLLDADAEMVGIAVTLRDTVANKSVEELLEFKTTIIDGIAALKSAVRHRHETLMVKI